MSTSIYHRLVDILKNNASPQMQYQVGFCFWLLTFEQEVSEQIQKCVACICLTLHMLDNVIGGLTLYPSSSRWRRTLPRRRLSASSWRLSRYVYISMRIVCHPHLRG